MLKLAVDGQRLRALTGWEYFIDKLVAPISWFAPHADAEDGGCSNFVGVVQLEFGKTRADVGLAYVDVQFRVCIDVVAVRMEQDWFAPRTDNLEDQLVPVCITRREGWYDIEISPVAIPLNLEALQPYWMGKVALPLSFELRAIGRNSIGDELLALA